MKKSNKKEQLNGLLQMANENQERIFHLVWYGGKNYAIVDLKDFGRIVKMGSLDFLQGFMEGFLFIK